VSIARAGVVVCLLVCACASRRSTGDGGAMVDPAVSRAWQWTPCWHQEVGSPTTLAKFAPDGTLAIATDDDRFVFQAPTWGAPARPIPFATRAGDDVAFSSDGSLLAGATAVVRVSDGSLVTALDQPSQGYCPSIVIRFSPAADYVVSFGGSSYQPQEGLCVWRVGDGRLVTQLAGVFPSAAVSNGQIVAVSGDPTWGIPAIVRFDLDGNALAPPALDTSGGLDLFAAVVSPDGSTLLATTYPSATTVTDAPSTSAWDLSDGRRLWTADQQTYSVKASVFSPVGDLVLVDEAVVRVRDGSRVREAPGGTPFVGPVTSWSLSPAGDAVAGIDRAMPLVVDVASGHAAPLRAPVEAESPSSNPYYNSGGVRSLALDRGGTRLVSLSHDGAIAWQLQRGAAPSFPSYLGTAPAYSRADMSPDGRWVSIAGDGRGIISTSSIRDIAYFVTPIGTAETLKCFWPQLIFSPTGGWVAGNGYGQFIEVFRTDDFTKIAEVPTTGCPRVAFSPDGERLVTNDHQVFRTSDWQRLSGPAGDPVRPTSWFDDVVVAPDGVGVLTSSCLQVFEPSDTIRCDTRSDRSGLLSDLTAPFPSFSSEGHWVAAGGTLLHLPSGETRTLDPAALVAVFTPDGDLIVGEPDGSLAGFCRSDNP
jgi:WD40 repeat protein